MGNKEGLASSKPPQSRIVTPAGQGEKEEELRRAFHHRLWTCPTNRVPRRYQLEKKKQLSWKPGVEGEQAW